MPFAAMGKRQIFVNLLGAGGEGFAEANLDLYGEESIVSVGSHIDILKQQLELILENEVKPDVATNFAGMSYGGFVLLHVFDRLRKEGKVFNGKILLDDPLMPGDLPFGIVSAVRAGVAAANRGALGIISGFAAPLTQQFVEDMYGVPNEFAERVTQSCFPAHGGFITIASSCLGYPDIKQNGIIYQRPTGTILMPVDQTEIALAHYYNGGNDNIRKVIPTSPYNSRHLLMPTLSGPREVLKAYPSVKSV